MKYRIQLKNNANLGHYYRLQTRKWWFPYWDLGGTFKTFEEAGAEVGRLRHMNARPKTIKTGTI